MTQAITILMNVAKCLVSQVVNTTLGTSVTPGTQTVSPPSMLAIFPTCELVVDYGTAEEEIVTVISTTSSTFTAAFAFPHPPSALLWGATMPEGYPDGQLFTQTPELLSYLADTQSEFLLRVRPVMASADINITSTASVYPAPADAIRVERISINGYEVYDAALADLDLENFAWASEGKAVPDYWFQDGTLTLNALTTPKVAFSPVPQVGNEAECWYSQCGPLTLSLVSPLLVPDVMVHALKYGVLERCWGKDGEQRDPFRESYCRKRFEFIAYLSMLFMEGVKAMGGKTAEVVGYSPLQLAPEKENALAGK